MIDFRIDEKERSDVELEVMMERLILGCYIFFIFVIVLWIKLNCCLKLIVIEYVKWGKN